MRLSRNPLLIYQITCILAFISLATPFATPPPYILSVNQSLQIPLLSLAAGPNITFNLTNETSNIQVINSMELPTTISLTSAPQNITASYVGDKYIAFVDQSLNFSYNVTYQQDSPNITLSNTTVQAGNNTQCTSMAALGEYMVIACAALENSTNNNTNNTQSQTLFLFNTSSESFSNISLNLSYTNLETPLPAIIKTAQTSIGPLAMLYFNNEALKNNSAVIILYNLDTLQSNVTNITYPGTVSIQSIEATYNGVNVFDASGTVYYGAYNNTDLTVGPLTQVAILNNGIIGSCVYNGVYPNTNLAVFSADSVSSVLNSQIAFTYSLPAGISATSCSLDSQFLYITAYDNTSNTSVPIIYTLNSDNNGYPLVQPETGFSNITATSTGQIIGQLLMVSPEALTILNVQEPKIQVTNVQENLLLNLTVSVNAAQEVIPVNITVISNPSQIYQKESNMPVFSAFQTPIVDLQDILVGPSLGVATGSGGFFNGVYGACSISNFGSLNISSYNTLSVQVSPTQQYSSTNNVISGVMIYTQDANLVYNNISITNLYSAGTWNSPQTCTSTIQSLSSTPYTLAATPQKCLFGQEFDLCLLSNSALVHISQNQGIIPSASQQQCQDVYLWQGSAYNQDVSVCINSLNLTILNRTGNVLVTITAEQAGLQAFSSQITTNSLFPNMLVVSSPQGLTGLQVCFSNTQPPVIVFVLDLTLEASSFVQLTSNRLVLVNFTSNAISEWDISDLSSPFLVGNYSLFSFLLNSTAVPTYQPIPNHLILSATNNSVPYLLTLQPGNAATSTLLYATSLQATSTAATFNSQYDPVNQYTLFLASSASEVTYFYAANSTYITLQNSTTGQTGCLYCSGSMPIQVSSNVATGITGLSLTMSYVIIAGEQAPTTIVTDGLTIKSGSPVSNMPNNWFQGTPLDYSLPSLTSSQANAVYITTPLNISQAVQSTVTVDSGSSQEISLFSDGNNLYILSANGLSSIVLSASTYQINPVTLTTPPANAAFVAGDAYPQGNTAIAYKNGANWGVYILQSGLQVALPIPILKVKVLSNLVFALTQDASNLIYVINTSGETPGVIMSVQSSVFELNPVGFEVANLVDGNYVVLVVDGSDNLYNFIVNITCLSSQQTVIPGFTSLVQADLPPSTLQILDVQLANQAVSSNSTADFLLTIGNFHSYTIQLAYNVTSVQFATVLSCFVQMPGHVTIGQSFLTDNFFLDVKQAGSVFYLYNYPMTITYPANSGQTGSYNYVKPAQRQILTSTQSLQLYAVNGQSGVAFVGNSQQASTEELLFSYSARRRLDQTTQISLNINIQSYSVSDSIEVGFNPSLSSTTLSDIDSKTVILTGGNDYGSSTIQISLDTPINILNSAYFIAFTCVFTVVFCVACIWFFRRAYKKRKMKMMESKASCIASDPNAAPANEEILIRA